MVRELDLKKPPSIAESIDWARALLLLGVDDIDEETFTDTMSVIVKHRTDMDLVAERVGVKLGTNAGCGRRRRRAGRCGVRSGYYQFCAACAIVVGKYIRAHGEVCEASIYELRAPSYIHCIYIRAQP